MTDRPRPTDYEAPMVVGDDDEMQPGFCSAPVCVLVIAVLLGNFVAVVNAAAAWNAVGYSNWISTQNFVLPPPCNK